MSKSLVSIIIGAAVVAAIILGYSAYKNSANLLSNNPLASSTPMNPNMTGSIISAASGKPGWNQLKTATSGISFEYPASLHKTYVSAAIWPPTAEILNQTFGCSNTGSVNSSSGGTIQVAVNGHAYCEAEAKAAISGSTYYRYVYAFPENGRTATIAFALRFANCATYNKTQKAACQDEEKSFSANNLADSIASTLATQ